MNEILYGGNKDSYGVIEKTDGRITISVYHENKKWRERIRTNKANPRYFLRYLGFSGSNPRAKYWLAKVVNDYTYRFTTRSVDFLLR